METGCYFDSHRGHYIVPAVITLAIQHGFIVDPFVIWALASYDDNYYREDFPSEGLIEVSDDAIIWLNRGPTTPAKRGAQPAEPPEIPEGTEWMWLDGDFGLYEVGDLD